MELKLKTDDTEESKLQDSSFEDDVEPYKELEPMVLHNLSLPESNVRKASAGGKIVKIVLTIIVCLVLVIVAKNIIDRLFPKSQDITDLVNQKESVIAESLDLDFKDAPEKVSSIHQYSGGSVSVHSAGDISVIYINNRQVGVKVDSKKYSMFNVKIGDGEVTADRDMSYDAYASFSVLNDMMDGGHSTSYFYFNPSKNDCLLLIINDNTNRVVSMTYYNDYQLISSQLSFIE